jgi:hypothetical protein
MIDTVILSGAVNQLNVVFDARDHRRDTPCTKVSRPR